MLKAKTKSRSNLDVGRTAAVVLLQHTPRASCCSKTKDRQIHDLPNKADRGLHHSLISGHTMTDGLTHFPWAFRARPHSICQSCHLRESIRPSQGSHSSGKLLHGSSRNPKILCGCPTAAHILWFWYRVGADRPVRKPPKPRMRCHSKERGSEVVHTTILGSGGCARQTCRSVQWSKIEGVQSKCRGMQMAVSAVNKEI